MIIMKLDLVQTPIESDKLGLLVQLVAVELKSTKMYKKDAVYRAIDYYIENHEKKEIK